MYRAPVICVSHGGGNGFTSTLFIIDQAPTHHGHPLPAYAYEEPRLTRRNGCVCPPGPLPILGDPNHRDIVASLSTRVPRILGLGTPRAPRAIIVVTAHWLEGHPTISSAPKHELYYDYYNFPEAAYSLKYDAPGSPEVAAEIRAAMLAEGLQPKLDAKRGRFFRCPFFISIVGGENI